MSAFYRVHFEAANNEDLRQSFALTDSADVPINLTTANLQMNIEALSGVDVLSLSLANGQITITDAVGGHFEVAVPAPVMGTLRAGAYRHDLILSDNGKIQRIWTGSLTLNRGVTV